MTNSPHHPQPDARRAQNTGWSGYRAETEDALGDVEVYEAMINPSAHGGKASSGGPSGSPMMMPPMMGMGGAGGASGAAGAMGQAAMASRASTLANPFVGRAPGVAGAGGTAGAAGGGAAGGGTAGAGMTPFGTAAAGSSAGTAGLDLDGDGVIDTPGGSIATSSFGLDSNPLPATDSPTLAPVVPGASGFDSGSVNVTEADPTQIDRTGSQWAMIGERLGALEGAITALKLNEGDTGFVVMPDNGFDTMNSTSATWARNGATVFTEISHQLRFNAQQYRDQSQEFVQMSARAQETF